jgi:DNA-binding transcriptional LysR family regulator
VPTIGTPTIDQVRVFLIVVEVGSFAGAARRLGRATSAVSYTIASLEQQLGVRLFDRENTRRPVLTDAGAAVVPRARAIAGGIDDLRASVRAVLDGLEVELSIVIDVMMPSDRVVEAVQAFEVAFPTVRLRLHAESLGAVAQLVQRGVATIGFGGGIDASSAGLDLISIGTVELFPVAVPTHPLAGRTLTVGEARRHRQLVLTVRSTFDEGRDIGVFGEDSWRLADLGAKHTMLLAGLGWGNMPEPMVRDDLAAGRLVRLDVPEGPSGHYPLHAIYRADLPPGPAGRWLVEHIVRQTGPERTHPQV